MEMLFLGGLGLPELIAIIVLVLLLFGAKKVPDLMKGLGKGVRSFKEGMKGLDSDAPSQNSSSGTSQPGQSSQSGTSQSDSKSGSAEDGH